MISSPDVGTDNNKKSFPIVTIVASAGGLEAVKELFTYLPKNLGMAFVYVQHLCICTTP